MMTFCIRKSALLVAACAALTAPQLAWAQSRHDEQQQLIAQIQTDKRAVVLATLQLDDAQVQAFSPIYDEYQLERKKLFDRTADLLDLYASNYGAMSDDAARQILKQWFALQEDEVRLARKYAKELGKVLLPAQLVRFVHVENKLDTLLHLKAVDTTPLAR